MPVNANVRMEVRSPATIDGRGGTSYNVARSEPAMNAKDLDLRIVSLGDVVLHEQVEHKRVQRLITRLQSDRLLKNPPIVAAQHGKFVVLDGATRTTALRRIGCSDIVVQVVDYDAPEIVLETWNHMLRDMPVAPFWQALRNISGLSIRAESADSATATLERRDSIATLVLADGQVFSLSAAGLPLPEQARLLNQVVAAYEGHGEMYRVAHTDVERLLAEHGQLSALVVFPRYRPNEIRELALNGSKLPMGITRHIIPGRVLRINIPLDVLERDQPLDQKNAWLDQWMRDRMLGRHVRFYQEPVFLFDE